MVKLQRSDDLQLAEHPSACTPETFAEWCEQRRNGGERLAVDLFSGAGGLSLGLEAAGWTVAVAVDNDAKALQTHRHNFPGLTLSYDLSETAGRKALVGLLAQTEIDLVAGGPPCQPFSRAGRSKIRSLVEAGHRPAHDHRRELWQAFLEIVLQVRPRAVLMENVPDMALGDDFRVLRIMVEALEGVGYYTEVRLVDAKDHGVPQHRKRLILLARRDTRVFTWLDPKAQKVTVRDAIADLPRLKQDDIGGRSLPYRRRRISVFAQEMRARMTEPVVWDHMTRPVRKDDEKIFARMDSSTLYADIPSDLRRYSADTFDDKYKRLGWDDLSRSITAHLAKDGYWYIHPEQLRTLTVREAARIQTFPDHFRFAGTRSDAFRQIGNAVPPLLGQAAAVALEPGRAENESKSPVWRWRDVRAVLALWADEQRRGRYWYFLPGEEMTPAVAAVSAVLTGHGTPGTDQALAAIRGSARLDVHDIARMKANLSTRAGQGAVERFLSLTKERRVWNDIDLLADALDLKPAQELVFRLLCGQDVMVANQPAYRVAARVAGRQSDKVNRLTDGRVNLARLMGAGREAPLRTAAVRLLGVVKCREAVRQCKTCPLRDYCAGASAESSAGPGTTLF